MLNRRGGEPDVVKVLDFGLVKALDDEKQAGLTQQNSLTGTPLYMSPEAIQMPNSVDARSDLYAVGAVGYFLLTGQPVFEAENVVDLCQMHVAAPPTPPRSGSRTPIPAELEGALLGVPGEVAGQAAANGPRAGGADSALCRSGRLDVDEADAWWGRHERGQAQPGSLSQSHVTRPNSDHMQTIDNR